MPDIIDPISELVKILDPYQRDYLKLCFENPMVITVKGRQIGISWTTALFCCISCLEKKNHKILVMSRDAVSARAFLVFCKKWAQALNILFEETIVDLEKDSTQISLKFPNGSEIIARSSNPNAPRSFSGTIIIDEFAFMDGQEEMYQSALSVTDQGYSFIIISTFNGIGNVYHDLVEKTRRGESEFKLFECDITKAVSLGLANRRGKATDSWRQIPAGPERNRLYLEYMRRRCLNEAHWRQEYLCQPISTESLITPELFDSRCYVPALTSLFEGNKSLGDLSVGIDIGRSGDPTSIVVLEHRIDPDPKVEESMRDVYVTVLVKSLYQTPYATQIEVFKNILNHQNVIHCQIDNNGIGGPVFEFLQKEFPGIVFPTSFHIEQKKLMFERLVGFLETDRLALAKDEDEDYRNQFLAMKRVKTKTGQQTYDGRTKHSHCDVVVATAMALYGATENSANVSISTRD